MDPTGAWSPTDGHAHHVGRSSRSAWVLRSLRVCDARGVSEQLPEFPYHPDPVATGCVEKSDATCLSCEQARGLIYTGPVYAVEELVDCLCPWCIADGSAAARFDAAFTDHLPVYGNVSEAVVAAVTTRTPGFSGWQQ